MGVINDLCDYITTIRKCGTFGEAEKIVPLYKVFFLVHFVRGKIDGTFLPKKEEKTAILFHRKLFRTKMDFCIKNKRFFVASGFT
jgi:hypothetical protein